MWINKERRNSKLSLSFHTPIQLSGKEVERVAEKVASGVTTLPSSPRTKSELDTGSRFIELYPGVRCSGLWVQKLLRKQIDTSDGTIYEGEFTDRGSFTAVVKRDCRVFPLLRESLLECNSEILCNTHSEK